MQYDWLKKSISRLDDIRLLSSDFESFEKAKKERKIRIRLLLKSADKADYNVARILKKCKKGKRCGKGYVRFVRAASVSGFSQN